MARRSLNWLVPLYSPYSYGKKQRHDQAWQAKEGKAGWDA